MNPVVAPLRLLSLITLTSILAGYGNNAHAQVGATTPFTTYEAEAGTLAGGATVVSLTAPPTTEFTSPQLEASGHAYVALTGTGQSITWTNNTSGSFTGINVRFSIPDSSSGGGTTATLDLYVNGTFRQAITLNSAQEWLYETSSDYNGQSNTPGTPANGIYPHKFWDDIHVLISGAAVAPGSTIALQQDSTNTAAFYWIDCVDLEPVPAALTQPANSLSITSYGAVANSPSTDSTTAIQNCINAAQSSGQIVWVPSGTFYLNTDAGLSATGITIEGAGPWYSTIYHNVPLPATTVLALFDPTSCTVQNLCFDSNAVSRAESDGDAAGINMSGSNWLITNVWVQHTSSGVWAKGNTGTVENSRMFDTWGDGININNGNTGHTGNNLTAINNFVRGTGDDGLAINSDASSVMMTNATLINNTSVAPWWANGIGIYGGINDVVQNNLVMDSVKLTGMSVGVFSSTGSALQSGVIQGNVIVRGGSLGYGNQNAGLKIGTSNETNSVDSVYVGSNTISNSMFHGIHIYKNTGNIVVENNVVTLPGLTGVLLDSSATGDGILNNNIVTNLNSGQAGFVNKSSSFDLDTTSEVVNSATAAASFSSETGGISTQTCSEGGLNIDDISNGSCTVYNNVNLNGIAGFVARVASYLPTNVSAGSIAVYLDSPTGTLIGTCSFNGTGGWQNWATVTCPVSGATGYHNVYLVYTGSLNVEWSAFQGTGEGAVEAASFNSETGGIGTQTCSEGGLNIDSSSSGAYTVYNNMDLNGVTAFAVREACTSSGTMLQICLDSPTSTPVATCPLPTTGGAQNWTTVTCVLNGISGYHTVYLVYTGAVNVEWFAFKGSDGAIEAASYNSVAGGETLETCSEGGQDLATITNGSYAVYNNVNLNGATSFTARVASAVAAGQFAGSMGIYLDSPTGTLIGTLAMAGTGGVQTWSTQACALSGATGYHNLYLVYTGSGPLPNLEWFAFQSSGNQIEASSFNSVSGSIGTETSSEGGLNLDSITNGSHTVYNQVNLTGMVSFSARVASDTSGGSMQIRLDSPTGTLIGTIAVPSTGGEQTWLTETCNLTATTGYHNIYLVYTGGSGNLFNVENFQFLYNPPPILTFSSPATPPATDTPLLPTWAYFVLVAGLVAFGGRRRAT